MRKTIIIKRTRNTQRPVLSASVAGGSPALAKALAAVAAMNENSESGQGQASPSRDKGLGFLPVFLPGENEHRPTLQ
jgi:hypothetical protein